jgi:hypothetical protein
MRDELSDCASYWDWFGPRLGAAGRATTTTTNGAVFNLRWTDGSWRLD